MPNLVVPSYQQLSDIPFINDKKLNMLMTCKIVIYVKLYSYNHYITISYTMTFCCPSCGNELVEHKTLKRLANVDGWHCKSCNAFYDKNELKKIIYDV